MAVLPTIADTWRLTLNWGLEGGVAARNVMHIFAPGDTGAAIAGTWYANVTPEMFDCMSSSNDLVSIDLLPLDGVSATQTFPSTIGLHGDGGGDTIPALAGIVSLRTSQRGSRGRGRLFLGPVCEDKQQSGSLDAISRLDMSDAWEAFRVAMEGDGRPVVVASYVHADQHLVLHAPVDELCGTVRRRQDQLR